MPELNAQIYRYGEAGSLPGLSIGVTRYPPRGARREDWVARGFFDVWMPLLAPSRALLAEYRKGGLAFAAFARKYRAEMRRPEPRQAIQLIAALALRQPVNLGCYCEDPTTCHRTVLRDLVRDAAKDVPPRPPPAGQFASPACSMPEIED